jgi:hypothetical protein
LSGATLATNAAEEIVIWTQAGGGTPHAAVRINDRGQRPNQPIGPPLDHCVTLTEAAAINDHGWIVADGVDSHTGVIVAYLLTPLSAACDVSTSAAALAAVSLSAVRSLRRAAAYASATSRAAYTLSRLLMATPAALRRGCTGSSGLAANSRVQARATSGVGDNGLLAQAERPETTSVAA